MPEVCKGEPAGQSLYAAVKSGGREAQVWLGALLSARCTSYEEAFSAFTDLVGEQDPNTALDIAIKFVDACEAIGVGACVTVVSAGSTGRALAEVQVHTSVSVPSLATWSVPLGARMLVRARHG